MLCDRTSLDAVARAHRGEPHRERDAILARAGYRVLRFSHRQLTREPTMVAHSLRSSA
jgi:very-short-patch-repair endonuclease